MKTFPFLLAFLIHTLSLSGQSGIRPALFIDCGYTDCDMDFIRNSIPAADFVRDRFQAQWHCQLSSQPTGNNGEQVCLVLTGQQAFAGYADTLKYCNSPQATDANKRSRLLQYLKTGLLAALRHTSFAETAAIDFTAPAADTKTTGKTDPWKYWAFTVGGRMGLNGDQNYSEKNTMARFSASKVTDAFKIGFSAVDFRNRNTYVIKDGDQERKLETINDFQEVNHNYTKSLNRRWSAGYEASWQRSTYDNMKSRAELYAGIEYNIFPYSASASKFLVIRGMLGADSRQYFSETVYDKTRETLFSAEAGLYASFIQRWGTVNGSVSWYNYLHDVSRNNLSVNMDVNINLVKGLSLSMGVSASRIRDQLQLAKEGASADEVLLRLRALSTGYNYYTSMGLNYRFGSKFNNVVNARFTNGRY